MRYQEDCPKCKGAGCEERNAGLLQIACDQCNATGKVDKAIPELKKGLYFCVQCESAHKEDSKLGISHLRYKAEASSGEVPDENSNPG